VRLQVGGEHGAALLQKVEQRARGGPEVGYGGAFVCRRASRLGLLPIGYGDGLVRELWNGAPVLVRGVRAPIVGVVSMNQTVVDVINDTDINGLAGAVSERLTAVGFVGGAIGNNDKTKVTETQVLAATADDLGAEAVAKELGGLRVTPDPAIPAGTVRVVLAEDYQGPGSGLDGTLPTVGTVQDAAAEAAPSAMPPSPVITAGPDDPRCVN
jgi:hypothetical protein